MNVKTGTWADHAACKGRINLFFPHSVRDHAERAKADKAIAVCNTCPVIDDCRTYALHANERFGVWGGMKPEELRNERQRLGLFDPVNA
jgi:WhiB family redox-sensing transcriptional regulator